MALPGVGCAEILKLECRFGVTLPVEKCGKIGINQLHVQFRFMPIVETAIQTIGDLSREIRALQSDDQQWLFRGHSDASWNLEPSIQRGYSPQQERYLTNEFRVRARSRYGACPSNNDYPDWLALMQHYGLPTRLLDWTYSPLIAAFFAVYPDFTSATQPNPPDACIWALGAGRLNESQGFEPLIFPLDATSYEPLIVPAFKNRDEPDTVGVAMALEHDSRIQLQQGAFTLHSIRTPINLMPGSDGWLRRIIIKSDHVAGFFEELHFLGVRRSNIFPDLSSLTCELKFIHQPGG
jgi:hypothetical protein